MKTYTIYRSPTDYPGKYVLRVHRALATGVVVVDKDPLYVGDSLEEARKKVPPGLVHFWPATTDPSSILETWL